MADEEYNEGEKFDWKLKFNIEIKFTIIVEQNRKIMFISINQLIS